MHVARGVNLPLPSTIGTSIRLTESPKLLTTSTAVPAYTDHAEPLVDTDPTQVAAEAVTDTGDKVDMEVFNGELAQQTSDSIDRAQLQ